MFYYTLFLENPCRERVYSLTMTKLFFSLFLSLFSFSVPLSVVEKHEGRVTNSMGFRLRALAAGLPSSHYFGWRATAEQARAPLIFTTKRHSCSI